MTLQSLLWDAGSGGSLGFTSQLVSWWAPGQWETCLQNRKVGSAWQTTCKVVLQPPYTHVNLHVHVCSINVCIYRCVCLCVCYIWAVCRNAGLLLTIAGPRQKQDQKRCAHEVTKTRCHLRPAKQSQVVFAVFRKDCWQNTWIKTIQVVFLSGTNSVGLLGPLGLRLPLACLLLQILRIPEKESIIQTSCLGAVAHTCSHKEPQAQG